MIGESTVELERLTRDEDEEATGKESDDAQVNGITNGKPNSSKKANDSSEELAEGESNIRTIIEWRDIRPVYGDTADVLSPRSSVLSRRSSMMSRQESFRSQSTTAIS